MKKCKCGKKMYRTSTRCISCYRKWQKNPKNNPAYINGETIKTHYCSICRTNKISYRAWFKGKGLGRCSSCSQRGNNNGNYKHGLCQDINEYYKKYNKTSRKLDIKFRLMWNLRARLNAAIKKNIKSKRTIELIGCSVDFLKIYLERKFTKGMSWSNYGKWHIDHIKPCSKFDMSKLNEQHKCFNYKNLQPLWAKDNLSKHNK